MPVQQFLDSKLHHHPALITPLVDIQSAATSCCDHLTTLGLSESLIRAGYRIARRGREMVVIGVGLTPHVADSGHIWLTTL